MQRKEVVPEASRLQTATISEHDDESESSESLVGDPPSHSDMESNAGTDVRVPNCVHLFMYSRLALCVVHNLTQPSATRDKLCTDAL